MMVTIQNHVILSAFNRQSTKTIQDNVLCVSNFHTLMFSNVLKFDAMIQTFFPWPCQILVFSIHSSLFDLQLLKAFALQMFTDFSSVCNWKQIPQSPTSKMLKGFFCDPSFFLFYQVKLKICVWIPQVLLIGKNSIDYLCLQKCALLLMHSTNNVCIR